MLTKNGRPVFRKLIQFLDRSDSEINSMESGNKNESSENSEIERQDLSEKPECVETMIPDTEPENQNFSPSPRRRAPRNAEKKRVSAENQGWATDNVPDNYFRGKTIVITGELLLLGERDPVAGLLKSLGARVTSSISQKTDIVIVGEKPGPSKLEKVAAMVHDGIDIRIMNELEFILTLHDEGVDLLDFTQGMKK